MEVAVAAKQATDADARAGVWVPLPGEPPASWNKSGTRGLWAVQTRQDDPIPCPEGCEEANPALVGRLVQA